jgi:hypothetical protein
MPKETLGLDFKHSLFMVQTLARYRATSVVLHKKEPHILKPFMGQDPQSVFCGNLDGMFNSSFRELKKEIKNWPEYNARFGNRIQILCEVGSKKWFSAKGKG